MPSTPQVLQHQTQAWLHLLKRDFSQCRCKVQCAYTSKHPLGPGKCPHFTPFGCSFNNKISRQTAFHNDFVTSNGSDVITPCLQVAFNSSGDTWGLIMPRGAAFKTSPQKSPKIPKAHQSGQTKSAQDLSCHLTHQTPAEPSLGPCTWKGTRHTANTSHGHCHSSPKQPHSFTIWGAKRLGEGVAKIITKEENKKPPLNQFL